MRIYFAVFFVFTCFTACEQIQYTPTESLKTLSLGQLVDLKKRAEAIEGLFMSTQLSDQGGSFSAAGQYLYICVRFLNDSKVNKKINKKGVPVLVQVSDAQEKAKAELVFVFHTHSHNGLSYRDSQFLYQPVKGQKVFKESFISLQGKDYRVWKVHFNRQNRLKEIILVPKNVPPEQIFQQEEVQGEEDSGGIKDVLIPVGGFARMSSLTCQDWKISHYSHSKETPSYLKVQYKKTSKDIPVPSAGTTPVLPDATPLSEKAPYKAKTSSSKPKKQ